MSSLRIVGLTTVTMIAFAGNSILGRFALDKTVIDAASFTIIRLLAGAIALAIIARLFRHDKPGKGNWWSALALFAYAACFSFAYIKLAAATGALLLFAAVQTTMIGYSIWAGERLRWLQIIGLTIALGGLTFMLLPGLSAPPIVGASLMLASGVAWGVYSLLGKRAGGDPIRITAGNFLRAVAFALVLILVMNQQTKWDAIGVGYAIASGAIASGIGYAIWYTVLPELKSTHAATIQLSVPVIAAIGGVLFLHESIDMRLVIASIAILGGIGLVVIEKRSTAAKKQAAQK